SSQDDRHAGANQRNSAPDVEVRTVKIINTRVHRVGLLPGKVEVGVATGLELGPVRTVALLIRALAGRSTRDISRILTGKGIGLGQVIGFEVCRSVDRLRHAANRRYRVG